MTTAYYTVHKRGKNDARMAPAAPRAMTFEDAEDLRRELMALGYTVSVVPVLQTVDACDYWLDDEEDGEC